MDRLASRKRSGAKLPAADLALAIGAIGLMELELWVASRPDDPSVLTWGTVLPLAAGGSLAIRRTRPLIGFVINFVAVGALIALTRPSDVYQYTNLLALYSVAAHDRRPITWLAVPASIAGIAYYFATFPDDGSATLMLSIWLFWIVTWLAGRVVGGSAERNRLRAERDLSVEIAEARRARLELEAERTRIARELHDIVGHTLAVMLVHAGAARRALPAGADDAEQALSTIERIGRSAMDDLDRVLGFLRTDEEGAARLPLPGIDDLPGLAADVAGDRLRVTVEVAADVETVPRSAQLTLYRIAQEALTNVVRHARASSVVVTLAGNDGELTLDVIDDGIGIDATAPGRGLAGMRHRAELHGGALTARRLPTGGTAVSCRLPLVGADAGAAAQPERS